MTEFPDGIRFKYSWRKYQHRVLEELQDHLTDKHLHVIAPPGSGKTVLGLEVAIRLNKPTLILAPTIAIRNQWIQRFCELFIDTSLLPDWISRDIRNPKFMTVVTYQGLHAACNDLNIVEEEKDEEEEPEEENGTEKATNTNLAKIANGLISQGIKTIVVDEAHHLKNEWWHSLIRIKEKLDPTVVGLTATPPYDVTATEWQRYIELNGPVDTEISVPELVIEEDLCPHQDYVYFTLPSEQENTNLLNFRLKIEKLFDEIRSDQTLIKAIENHSVWLDPIEELDWIYNNLGYYSSCLIFLHANGREIPETHLEVIGDDKLKIPELNYEWLETLLEFYLYKDKDQFNDYEDHKKALENRLRRYGAIERRQINFSYNKSITGFLSSSISKLNGIQTIVNFEYNQLGSDLRMVILTDFIRKEYFINSDENNLELNKMGVIPIFEKLRRDNYNNKKIGVLTGSLVIIPKSAYQRFEEKAAEYNIQRIISIPVSYDNNYVVIHHTEQLKHDIVHIITQIFQSGEIEVLIGTKSLLGEGWDAPAINSLILASFVGSFVLSNQMRGRAIRTQRNNLDKTGNIWHLVCLDPTSKTGGDDFDLLKRRFRSFVGVSFKENPGIENGIGRLNLPDNIYFEEAVEKINKEMFTHAADRESLKKKWEKALESGLSLVEEIRIPFPKDKDYRTVKSIYLNKTIRNLIVTLGFGIMAYLEVVLESLGRAAQNIKTLEDLYVYLTFIGIGGILFFGRQTYKTMIIYLNYRDIAKDLKQIGDALLLSLIKAQVIHTDRNNLTVETTIDQMGAVYCHLDGGSTFEKSTFINALQELIAPIGNPRYVIVRKSRFLMFINQRDYHSVPEVLGRNKILAEYFKSQWDSFVGNCELIFTRTLEGRKLLLKSRIKSLAAQFDNEVEHIKKWR